MLDIWYVRKILRTVPFVEPRIYIYLNKLVCTAVAACASVLNSKLMHRSRHQHIICCGIVRSDNTRYEGYVTCKNRNATYGNHTLDTGNLLSAQ